MAAEALRTVAHADANAVGQQPVRTIAKADPSATGMTSGLVLLYAGATITVPCAAMAQGTVEAKDASAPNADALGQDSSLQSLSGDAADGVGAVSKMGVFAEATDNYVGVDTGMGVGMGMGMDDNDDGGNGLDEALTALDNLARKVSAEGEVPDTPNGLDTALHTLQNASARLSRRHSSSPTIEAMQGDSHAGPVDVSPALADPANELAAVPPAKSRAARPKQLPPTPKPYTGSDNTAGNPDGGEDRAQSTPLKELLRERRAQRSQAGALDKGAPSPLAATNPALLRITEEVFKVSTLPCSKCSRLLALSTRRACVGAACNPHRTATGRLRCDSTTGCAVRRQCATNLSATTPWVPGCRNYQRTRRPASRARTCGELPQCAQLTCSGWRQRSARMVVCVVGAGCATCATVLRSFEHSI